MYELMYTDGAVFGPHCSSLEEAVTIACNVLRGAVTTAKLFVARDKVVVRVVTKWEAEQPEYTI